MRPTLLPGLEQLLPGLEQLLPGPEQLLPGPIFSGALRAPKCFTSFCFPCFWDPNAQIPRRASRAGMLHSLCFSFGYQIPPPC